ncbi:MAG: radical SAM protein [Verrucomicrobia bacterium]|nr:radical SAM protein [Verrucomicrobiota bacterium]
MDKARLVGGRLDAAYRLLERCTVCPRCCEVNRLVGERGVCGAPHEVVVSSVSLHHGEEPPVSGLAGSGTIFFTHCNLKCVFCQNYPISHQGQGEPMTSDELADAMLRLERLGAHNVNLVTPTHYAPQILEALGRAFERGLAIPVLYNCGGYEPVEMLELFDGVIDIYMPDMKYADAEAARRLSGAPNYPEVNRRAVREMHRQVGDLVLDPAFGHEGAIAVRGLLVRHLVLPNNLAGTDEIMRFLAKEISPDTAVSLLSQYFPQYHASRFPEIARRITADEYRAAQEAMERHGLHRGWYQSQPIDTDTHSIKSILARDTRRKES